MTLRNHVRRIVEKKYPRLKVTPLKKAYYEEEYRKQFAKERLKGIKEEARMQARRDVMRGRGKLAKAKGAFMGGVRFSESWLGTGDPVPKRIRKQQKRSPSFFVYRKPRKKRRKT